MRISDWSSDVCSSDLADHRCGAPITLFGGFGHTADVRSRRSKVKTSAAAAKEKIALKPASEMPKSDHCTASKRISGAFMIESSVTGPPEPGAQVVTPSQKPYSTPACKTPNAPPTPTHTDDAKVSAPQPS